MNLTHCPNRLRSAKAIRVFLRKPRQDTARIVASTTPLAHSAVSPELDDFVKPVSTYKKRECYRQLQDYVYGDTCDRVYILYGLRRTGKTTLIRQIISEMDEAMRSRTAFLQMQDNKHLSDLNHDLKCLEEGGYRYVFIDEVTLLDDFIEGAALFSDIYAASGMKIVLSGTDSLGFIFTEDE